MCFWFWFFVVFGVNVFGGFDVVYLVFLVLVFVAFCCLLLFVGFLVLVFLVFWCCLLLFVVCYCFFGFGVFGVVCCCCSFGLGVFDVF